MWNRGRFYKLGGVFLASIACLSALVEDELFSRLQAVPSKHRLRQRFGAAPQFSIRGLGAERRRKTLGA